MLYRRQRPMIFLSLLAAVLASSLPAQAKGQTSVQVKEEGEATPESSGQPFEARMKIAMQPNGFALFTYMQIHEGQEEAYLEAEAEWKKIHERMTNQGRLSGWGVAKAQTNDLGIQYVTWKSFPSLEALDEPYDLKDIREWMGSEAFDNLMEKTKATRKIIGEEVLRSEDYTLDNLTRDTQQESNKLSFFLGYMTPADGKDEAYVRMEKLVFQPDRQNLVNHNPNFLGWRLEKRLFSWGEVPEAKYRTINIFLREKSPLTEEQESRLQRSKPTPPAEFSETNISELRSMTGLIFDVVMTTDKNQSAIVQAWAELEGTWVHHNENGSKRVKVISPFQETLIVYDAEGNLKNENTSPMRIYFKDGIKHFSTYHPNRTWNSIYEIHDGKWYEQMRGIYHETNGEPDRFLIYERLASPEAMESEDQALTESPSETEEASNEVQQDRDTIRFRRLFRGRNN